MIEADQVWWEIMKCNFSLSQTHWMGLPFTGAFCKTECQEESMEEKDLGYIELINHATIA
jgi:hypothetical protein